MSEGIHLSDAYISRCSLTVSPSKMQSNCGQYPIYFLAFINPFVVVTSCPLMVTSPDVGLVSPVRHLKQFVFPAPDTPRRAKHSPYSRPKVILSTATILPYSFLRCLTLTGKLDGICLSTDNSSLVISSMLLLWAICSKNSSSVKICFSLGGASYASESLRELLLTLIFFLHLRDSIMFISLTMTRNQYAGIL